jgi:hypothetical protein
MSRCTVGHLPMNDDGEIERSGHTDGAGEPRAMTEPKPPVRQDSKPPRRRLKLSDRVPRVREESVPCSSA